MANFTFILKPYNDNSEISLMSRNMKQNIFFCPGCHKREALTKFEAVLK